MYVQSLIVLWSMCVITGSSIRQPGDYRPVDYSSPGDLNIGVMVSMTRYSPTNMCSQIYRYGFPQAEAIAFAIAEINGNPELLPNMTLGFHMVDDCAKDTTALTKALHFTQTTTTHDKEGYMKAYDVIGVIGCTSSRNTVQMADLLSLFQVPVISYISTSPVLSDKDVYPFFSRTVPSDNLQVEAFLDIITRFDWSYVSIVYESGSYGQEWYKSFMKMMTERRRCIAVAKMVPRVFTDVLADSIIQALMSASQARAVVLVVSSRVAGAIFQSVRRLGHVGHFIWLGSDSWGSSRRHFNGHEDVAHGAITIGFHMTTVERFDTYMKHLTPNNAMDNPWFILFYESLFNCKFNPTQNDSICDKTKSVDDKYSPGYLTGLIINAVYSYAHSLHNLLTKCTRSNVRDCVTGKELLRFIRNVSFIGEHGLVSFDEFGDGSITYAVRTLRKMNSSYTLDVIGLWDTTTRHFQYFNADKITWNPSSNTPPNSRCSESCKPGFQAVVTKPHCCSYCERCHRNDISVKIDNKLKCKMCPLMYWPDSEKTRCILIDIMKISLENWVGISVFVLIIFVIIVTLITIVLYMRNFPTFYLQFVTWMSTYFMLAGIIASSGTAVLFFLPSTYMICYSIQIGFHTSLSFLYSPFLVRTHRVYRLTKGNHWQYFNWFTGSKSVIMLYLVLVFTQIIISVTMTMTHPPNWETRIPDVTEPYVESACQLNHTGFILSLTYNLLLVIMSTYFVIYSRNAPPEVCSIRECRFNNTCVYSIILLLLTFAISYFTTSKLFVKSILLILNLLVNSLILLCLLILPKLYDFYHSPT